MHFSVEEVCKVIYIPPSWTWCITRRWAADTHIDLIGDISVDRCNVLRKWLIAQHFGLPDVTAATQGSLRSQHVIFIERR